MCSLCLTSLQILRLLASLSPARLGAQMLVPMVQYKLRWEGPAAALSLAHALLATFTAHPTIALLVPRLRNAVILDHAFQSLLEGLRAPKEAVSATVMRLQVAALRAVLPASACASQAAGLLEPRVASSLVPVVGGSASAVDAPLHAFPRDEPSLQRLERLQVLQFSVIHGKQWRASPAAAVAGPASSASAGGATSASDAAVVLAWLTSAGTNVDVLSRVAGTVMTAASLGKSNAAAAGAISHGAKSDTKASGAAAAPITSVRTAVDARSTGAADASSSLFAVLQDAHHADALAAIAAQSCGQSEGPYRLPFEFASAACNILVLLTRLVDDVRRYQACAVLLLPAAATAGAASPAGGRGSRGGAGAVGSAAAPDVAARLGDFVRHCEAISTRLNDWRASLAGDVLGWVRQCLVAASRTSHKAKTITCCIRLASWVLAAVEGDALQDALRGAGFLAPATGAARSPMSPAASSALMLALQQPVAAAAAFVAGLGAAKLAEAAAKPSAPLVAMMALAEEYLRALVSPLAASAGAESFAQLKAAAAAATTVPASAAVVTADTPDQLPAHLIELSKWLQLRNDWAGANAAAELAVRDITCESADAPAVVTSAGAAGTATAAASRKRSQRARGNDWKIWLAVMQLHFTQAYSAASRASDAAAHDARVVHCAREAIAGTSSGRLWAVAAEVQERHHAEWLGFGAPGASAGAALAPSLHQLHMLPPPLVPLLQRIEAGAESPAGISRAIADAAASVAGASVTDRDIGVAAALMVLAIGLRSIPKSGELWLAAGRLYTAATCWADARKAFVCAGVAAAYTPQNGDSAVDIVRMLDATAADSHVQLLELCRSVNAAQPSFGAASAMLQTWQTPELERLCGPVLVARSHPGVSTSMLVPDIGCDRTSTQLCQQVHGGDYVVRL